MTESKQYGRTFWDFATEVTKSRTTIALLVVAIVGIVGLVYLVATTGEISISGNEFHYQGRRPAPAKTAPPNTKGYLLPVAKDFSSDAAPILDGTINLGTPRDTKDGAYFMSGANIDIVAFAVRTPRGDALVPRIVGNKVFVKPTDTVLELEYKGNVFVVETESQRGDEGTFVMTVKKTEVPTMKLKTLSEYAGG